MLLELPKVILSNNLADESNCTKDTYKASFLNQINTAYRVSRPLISKQSTRSWKSVLFERYYYHLIGAERHGMTLT